MVKQQIPIKWAEMTHAVRWAQRPGRGAQENSRVLMPLQVLLSQGLGSGMKRTCFIENQGLETNNSFRENHLPGTLTLNESPGDRLFQMK